MTDFKDSQGRIWTIKLTLGGVKRVMEKLGVNLLNLSQYADSSDDSVTMKLINDDLFVGEIVATLVEEQAKAKGLNFLNELDGETINAAQEAFLAEFAFFFKARKNQTAEAFVAEIQKARAAISTGATSVESQDAQD